ncbi:tetratricopeptide repeat protein [Candidatus Latescibacterota bacterium]
MKVIKCFLIELIVVISFLFCIPNLTYAQKPIDLIKQGEIRLKQNDIDGAIEKFLQAISRDPKIALAYYQLGLAYEKKGDIDNAIASFNTAIEIFPSYNEARMYLFETLIMVGKTYEEKGLYNEALLNYHKALDLNPNNKEINEIIITNYVKSGKSFENKRDYNSAIEYYNKALSFYGDNAEIYYSVGMVHFLKGEIDEALTNYWKAIKNSTKNEPINSKAYYQVAISLFKKGDIDNAKKALLNVNKVIDDKDIISLDQNNDVNLSLANILYNDEMYDIAMELYLNELKDNPKNVSAYIGLGKTFLKIGEFDSSLRNLNKAIELDPNNSGAFYYLTNTYLEIGNLTDAFSNAENAIELDSSNFSEHYSLAQKFLKYGSINYALEIAHKSLQNNPNGQNLYILIGDIYESQGKINDAITNYQKVIEISPNNSEVLIKLGMISVEQGNRDKSIEYFNKVIENDPKNYEIYYLLGNNYEKNDDKEKAKDNYYKAVELDSELKLAEKYSDLMNVYKRAGNTDKTIEYFTHAINYYNQALAYNPNNKFALEKLKEFEKNYSLASLQTQVSSSTSILQNINPSSPETLRLPSSGLHWAVVIGVSKYQDSQITPLRYASKDAKTIYDWLVSPSGGKYSPSQVNVLLDENATYQNIREALFVWLQQALEEDVITLYFAGHGSPESPDSPDNLFFLPYDTNYDNIATTAFPMWDIETALKRFIKAKKVVVMADACHSGGVGQAFDIARRANRGIKKNTISSGFQNLSQIGDGVCVISASEENQYSQEGQQWGGGHGIFTYYILEGLKGNADYNNDSLVTLGELIPYLSQTVRRETKNAQSPTVAGRFDPALSIAR